MTHSYLAARNISWLPTPARIACNDQRGQPPYIIVRFCEENMMTNSIYRQNRLGTDDLDALEQLIPELAAAASIAAHQKAYQAGFTVHKVVGSQLIAYDNSGSEVVVCNVIPRRSVHIGVVHKVKRRRGADGPDQYR